MTAYLKTKFDSNLLLIHPSDSTFLRKNVDHISFEDFPAFEDLENSGVLNIKINPIELKNWYSKLPEEVKKENFIIVWSEGYISIPGNVIEQYRIER